MGKLSLRIASLFLAAPLAILAQKVPHQQVKDLGDNVVITGSQVSWDDPVDGFTQSVSCSPARGKYLAITDDEKHAACCPAPDLLLKGSRATEFHCCAAGHDVAGDANVGYQCCPVGDTFDGTVCKPQCTGGKDLDVNGNCVCPTGQEEDNQGFCVVPPPDNCSSGLETGKCYIFKGAETGRRLSWAGQQYSEAERSKEVIPGKFQLCRDETCSPGLPVNPSHTLYIKDLHAAHPSTSVVAHKVPGQWLDGATGGTHISKAQNFAKAGKFSITKYTCGTYCLTGVPQGLAMACPHTNPSFSFYNGDFVEACVEFELIEVPCDIRSDANNCMWTSNPDQCCGKVACGNAAGVAVL
ncbi:related to cysteine-rich secreted protein [Fusarium fujikuroi]|nr:related to cysteine-rich secreted protein [Fusarium fujikuroi]